jgi:hypothetical protein
MIVAGVAPEEEIDRALEMPYRFRCQPEGRLAFSSPRHRPRKKGSTASISPRSTSDLAKSDSGLEGMENVFEWRRGQSAPASAAADAVPHSTLIVKPLELSGLTGCSGSMTVYSPHTSRARVVHFPGVVSRHSIC